MDARQFYLFAADAMLFVHLLFVLFIIGGLLLIILGKLGSWNWVKEPWFRFTHLIGIAIVVLQSWLGLVCPLTTWEMTLRAKAGDAVYEGAFITHWLETILYFQAPQWVFIVCYTLFGTLVAISWFWVRPRPIFKHHKKEKH